MPTLTWVSRDDDLKRAAAAPYRLLEAVPELSAGDPSSGNMLIQGDNLDALKALLPYYAGRVKCIYIDPPYNTRSAFEHYDDNLQHAEWLAMIYPRLELLRELLGEEGSIWVSIDDSEGHYLKVILDEIFGRQNFVATFSWQQRTTRENRKVVSANCEYIHAYAKNFDRFGAVRNGLALSAAVLDRYKNPDNDPRGDWQSVSANAQAGHGTASQFYELEAPNGKRHTLPAGRCWLYTRERMAAEVAAGNIWFGRDGNGVPRIKKFLDRNAELTPETLWLASDVGTNDEAKKETLKLFEGVAVFETPKPERLIGRIIHIASNRSDLVLDSFLGSGTTAAVAHKMGRRYIGVETGSHAVTHCVPRLLKVIDGEQGGVSQNVGWSGGGGFGFYRLAESVFGDDGRINPTISFAHLAAHVWFSETGTPMVGEAAGPWLGAADGRGLALLYNGILGDKSVTGGNVLTAALLKRLRADGGCWAGPITIYGEASRLGPERLKAEQVTFKQTPYDVRAR